LTTYRQVSNWCAVYHLWLADLCYQWLAFCHDVFLLGCRRCVLGFWCIYTFIHHEGRTRVKQNATGTV